MIKININSMLLIFIIAIIAQPSCAITPNEAKELQTKAALAQKKLKNAVEEGKDVSKIVPMMKQVKVLGDKHKLEQASMLLDEILLEFERLNTPYSSSNNLVLDNKHEFQNPRKVNIKGYPYNAMEAFITRDGKYIFFNSDEKDTPKSNKNIYYAKRIDATNFKYMGEIKGINSAEVDAVPTMDNNNNFYFVSVAHYGKRNDFATVYSGKFNNGRVSNIKPHPELSLKKPGWLNMDIEISADGKTLYATQTYFSGGSPPKKSYFFVAHLKGNKFVVDKRSDEIFKNINTSDLEYAASVSNDELEIFFTRLKVGKRMVFTTYRATRTRKDLPFSKPVRIKAITGIAEAATITHDGQFIYFHKKSKGHFNLYVLQRKSG